MKPFLSVVCFVIGVFSVFGQLLVNEHPALAGAVIGVGLLAMFKAGELYARAKGLR